MSLNFYFGLFLSLNFMFYIIICVATLNEYLKCKFFIDILKIFKFKDEVQKMTHFT